PVGASREYRNPLSLPINTRPEAIVGCVFAETPEGKPNTHLSFSRGTCVAVSPAACAGWNRELEASVPQPFQAGPRAGSVSGGVFRRLFCVFFSSSPFSPPTRAPRLECP